MTTIPIPSAKVTVMFPEGKLPSVDPDRPAFVLNLGDGVLIHGTINAKAARKLATWKGGAVLQGRLTAGAGKLCLTDAGFTWIDPRPAPATPAQETAHVY